MRQTDPARIEHAGEETARLMEEVVRRENVWAAYQRVVRNGGAAGVDGMTVDELLPYCRRYWPRIKEELLSGRYPPQPVRKVEIPKPGGGRRTLGIPTVVDRMIQQALLQVLQPEWDPTFSEDSFGFRPGRSAHDAIEHARGHVAAGYEWVVDLDLLQFFDRVNHDVLMARVARRVRDKRVLRLIRRFLEAGMMEGGLASRRVEGTPQGGPLSPLLSNLLLHELDRELERRGHRFVRYADDANVYVRSREAGERVLASLERFLWKRLRLRINGTKSGVGRTRERTFLGFRLRGYRPPRVYIAPEVRRRLRRKLQPILRRARGRRLSDVLEELAPVIRGWVGYYRKAETPSVFEELDEWLRRKLRCVVWKQWKHSPNRYRRMRALGLSDREARSGLAARRGPWWNAQASHLRFALPNAWLRQQGLPSFLEEYRRLQHAL